MENAVNETADLPTRLRSAFAAWGLRNLGDEAAEEIERLRAMTGVTERCSNIPLAERLWSLLTSANGLCRLCSGSGHLFCYQDGQREFWPCPACGGVGARAVFSRPEIRSHAR